LKLLNALLFKKTQTKPEPKKH